MRRRDLRDYVVDSGVAPRHDETNDDMAFRRNRVRQDLVPLLCAIAERDVVPILARQASVVYEELVWLDELGASDADLALDGADCRALRAWPRARLRRWLRAKLEVVDGVGERHPPSAAEVERALRVVDGDVVATELSGARRLARREQHLSLEDDSTTLTIHG